MRKLFTILAAAACVFAVMTARPLAPTARADTLPNGYSITCTPNGGNDVVCNVTGCPRVYGEEAGDVIHFSGTTGQWRQPDVPKACKNTATFTILPLPQTFSIQGCRKHFPGTDDCGAWSNYTYTPPAAASPPAAAKANNPPPAENQNPVACLSGPDAGKKLPPGSKCAADAPPTKCPAGSATDTVPAGHQCAAPANAVGLSITQSGPNAHAAVKNNSNLPAKCNYVAKKTSGLFGPQEVDRSIDVPANGTGTINDMLWPPPGISYNASVSCTVTYDGKQTSIGQASQPVSG